MERVRRLSLLTAALACALPQIPRLVGSPAYGCFGFRHGSDQCALLSLVLMGFSLVGILLTQRALPMSVRRWTVPKALALGFVWLTLAQTNLFV